MSKPRRFRPSGWDALEERVVLSTIGPREPVARPALRAFDRSPAAFAAVNRPDPSQRMAFFQQQRALMAQAQQRLLMAQARQRAFPFQGPSRFHQTPEVVIDQQYAAFAADIFRSFEEYRTSLQVPLPQPLQLTLSEGYDPGSGLFLVDQLNLPTATPESPLQVAARPPGESARLYQVTGSASGILSGVQAFNPLSGGFGPVMDGDNLVPAPDAAMPAGTVLEISVPATAPDVADITNQFLAAVSQRTLTLSSDLVTFFNRLPIRLPRLPGPHHTPRPETAIQFYISSQIAGQEPQILLQQLLNQPLPPGPTETVDVYVETVSSIIETSRQQVREGVRLLFAGRSVAELLPVIPAQP